MSQNTTKPSEGVMVSNTLEEVKAAYQKANEAPRIVKGFRPQAYIAAAEAEAIKEEELAKLAADG